MEKIGSLRRIRRYPVKGMKGEDLDTVLVNASGVEGDRVYAFMDKKSANQKFPWMTAREKHEMILFAPRFISKASLSDVVVRTPEGEQFSLPGENFLEYLKKTVSRDLTLKFEEAGVKDSRPLSLISIQSIGALGEELGIVPLEQERFRANFYVDWDNKRPYFENELVGRSLMIGGAEVRIDKRNSRCVVPSLDPEDGQSTPRILETIKKAHEGCIGVYALTNREGSVSPSDAIYLL